MSEYTIQELIKRTGIPRRTIYFYTQQGILPPLQGAGLSARYQEAHMVRLRLIPLLRHHGMRLDQIREYFESQSESSLVRRLNEEVTSKSLPVPNAPPTPPPGAFVHYSLPKGMTLLVPADIAASQPGKVEEILHTIQEKLDKE